ncbi:hypothetical protein [Nocardia sp. NPDC024068]|uniref:hypothetical protein n=1 Tax=Nocardia sp. NPDC024068 TaxID=3157197 RepID=UPI0033E45676
MPVHNSTGLFLHNLRDVGTWQEPNPGATIRSRRLPIERLAAPGRETGTKPAESAESLVRRLEAAHVDIVESLMPLAPGFLNMTVTDAAI